MVDDAGRLAGTRLAEDRDVLGRVTEIEGNVRAALQSGGVAKRGERAGRLTDPEPEVAGSLRSGPTDGVASTPLRSGNVGSGLPSSARTSGRNPNPPTMAAPASVASPCESG